MVGRPSGGSGGRVGPVTDNGAGQDGGWRQRGQKATKALAETWAALAEACYELSGTEWALPTECPGWDVKDQLSHLIGIERAIMGEAAPRLGRPPRRPREERLRGANEPWVAVRAAVPGAAVRAEFVEVTETRLAQLGRAADEEWAAVGWSPVGEVPYAVFMEVRVFDSWVHEQDARRALDRPGGRQPGFGHVARPGAGRHALRGGQEGGLPRRHRRPLRGLRPRPRRPRLHRRGRGRAGPPAATMWRRR